MEQNVKKKEIKINLFDILKVVILLYVVLITVGILTYVLPAGVYDTQIINGKTSIIEGTYHILENGSATRVPWYRWLTVPIESLFLNSARMKMYEIFALLLILGGCFKVLEDCGAMNALIKLLIVKFKEKRFLVVWAITILAALLSSFFGIQDELLILFPIVLSFCEAMGWSNLTAAAFILIGSSTGFTCAILNPYTIGTCADLAGISVLDGAWFRAIMLVILLVFTGLFLVKLAKNDEKKRAKEENNNNSIEDMVLTIEEKKKANYLVWLFAFVLAVVVVFSAVPALQKLGLGLIVMGLAFVVGTLIIGTMLMNDENSVGKAMKRLGKAFLKGMKAVAPSLFVIATAYSIMYLAERAQILHTIFHFMYDLLSGMSPYIGALILLFVVLVIEFFIPSATAKAALLIPLLTLAPIPGISTNVIILCYLLGDGYTNVVFPTCGTLMIGLGISDVSLIDWYKRTGLFHIFLLATSIIFVLLAVAVGL